MNTTQSFQTLAVAGGHIAYEVAGDGPLVICAPGMGDLRTSYRLLAPLLVEAADLVALADHLGGPAVLVGNSMAAGAGVIAAAERPELVRALVLLSPFVRNPKVSAVMTAVMRVATAAPWVATVWKAYLPSLYAGRKPADLTAYLASVSAAMRRPGYASAFSRTARLSHDPAEQALAAVTVPTLVVMGELDPDFPDARAEAQWIADSLRGTVVMVPEAGHYPQSQRPELVAPAVADFLGGLPRG
jgi:pimeloyl-ACP methyl ester carboxylesterase